MALRVTRRRSRTASRGWLGPFERRRTARMRSTSSSKANGLPFEARFAVRAALFGPIVLAHGPAAVRARERRLEGEC
jgi:hypothetical protein